MNTAISVSRSGLAHLLWAQFLGMVCAMANDLKGLLGLLKDVVYNPPTTPSAEPKRASTRPDNSRASVLVLDASGSMMEDDWKPTRLDGAKAAAKAFVKRLSQEEPEARVAVVGYGSSATRVCGLTAARHLAELHSRMDELDCLGSTNMRAGLHEALRLFKGHGQNCQVILLTDGHNTERCPKSIAQELRQFAVVECVGIGGSPGDVDEELLRDLASENPDGTKRYRWIGEKEQLVQHFHKLAGRLSRT